MNWNWIKPSSVAAAGVALSLVLGSCSKGGRASDTATTQASAPVTLIGAGSTFSALIYQQWFKDYHAKHPNVIVEYQAIGSGGGIGLFTKGTVDFGASDAAMTDGQMGKVAGGVLLVPMTAGSEVLAFDLEGVKSLKLSRAAYSGIFLGKVTKWTDPVITRDNPGVNLPDSPINVVHRSDASGTTFIFTQHLSAISAAWKSGPGFGTEVNWPAGVGGKGNAGVTALIKQTPGSIGYIEYGYASTSKLPFAELQNKAGKFVPATLGSASETLAAIKLPANMRVFVPDPDGDKSYPIVSFTWLLVHPSYSDAAKGNTLKDVIDYCLTDGQKISKDLGYIPMPDNVVSKVKEEVNTIKAGG